MIKYAEIILPLSLSGTLTYSIPVEMEEKAIPGMRVNVPVGKSKTYIGIIESIHNTCPDNLEVKDILSFLDDHPCILPLQLQLWRWISQYYISSIGDILRAALPFKLKKISNNTRKSEVKNPDQLNTNITASLSNIKSLSSAQQIAYDKIISSLKLKNVVLLHGITSSGKTEIYIHLIEKYINKGQQVLYLLPEIALTVQITQRLKFVFGDRLGIYHSGISDTERLNIWKKQLSDNPFDIILGARSAVFLPFQRLSFVIIDEEHDSSFKQSEPSPRYNGRDTAIMLASMTGAKTVLGSATPCAETLNNVTLGKYDIVHLNVRHGNITPPKISIVDIIDLKRNKLMKGIFSPLLIDKIKESLDNGLQIILFLNRRGFAPLIICDNCGWIPRCLHCDVSLTAHQISHTIMSCHYCGRTYSMPINCPKCGGKKLIMKGYGTEKVEQEVLKLFPMCRVSRLDYDTTRSITAYKKIINDFSEKKSDILIGTQMVSKGLDFAFVNLVGILDADTLLNIPDFRSYEHAFTLMSQVSGRAGRRENRGYVILQTRQPNLSVIKQLVENNFKDFFRDLMSERKEYNYPPLSHLINIYFKHTKKDIVEIASQQFIELTIYNLKDKILGPDIPLIERIHNLYIRKIMLKLNKLDNKNAIKKYLLDVATYLKKKKNFTTLQIFFDVDPI